MTDPGKKTYGQVAYEAYVAHRDGKSIRGEDLPAWEDQAEEIRSAWEGAGLAVYIGFAASAHPDNIGS